MAAGLPSKERQERGWLCSWVYPSAVDAASKLFNALMHLQPGATDRPLKKEIKTAKH